MHRITVLSHKYATVGCCSAGSRIDHNRGGGDGFGATASQVGHDLDATAIAALTAELGNRRWDTAAVGLAVRIARVHASPVPVAFSHGVDAILTGSFFMHYNAIAAGIASALDPKISLRFAQDTRSRWPWFLLRRRRRRPAAHFCEDQRGGRVAFQIRHRVRV